MTQRTAARRLIEMHLGRDLAVVLIDTPQSWRSLSEYVLTQTGISVSHETLRGWLAAEHDTSLATTA